MLRARKFRLWILSALLVLGGLAGALKGDAVRAAPAKSPQQDNIVISEFRTRGPNGGNDEFIEIFNPTNSPIDISNWEIWISNSSGGTSTTPSYTFPAGIVLQSGQHFLIANSSNKGYSGVTAPDDTYTTGIPDSGGIALALPDNIPVDQVGTSPGSIFQEGTTLLPQSGDLDYLNQGFERGPGGSSGNCTDIDNNASDFHLVAPANPQNSSSPLTTACIGPDQTITFTSTAPTGAVVGGATYTPTAAATSGLPVEFTIDSSASSFCSISGGVVSFTAVGTCVIDANQAGNANYNAAPQVQQSFVVGKSNQAITFTTTAPADAMVGGATYTPTATANSGLIVNFTIDTTASSVCSISGGVVSFDETGICKVDANQAGDTNYNPASQVQQSFAVGKGAQTITFTSTAPASAVVGGATYTPTTAATSGLSVSLTIDTTALSVCSINAGVVSFTAVGTCVIDANQAGDARYNAAPQIQQSFHVGQTATATPSAPAHLVISEFRSRGPNGADDEFVELYNPSGAAVNIGAWLIKKSSSCGTSITNLVTIPDNTILLAGQHYLAAATGSSLTGADLTYTASLADDGGVALVTALGTVVDQAGMCTSTQYLEGTNLLPLAGTSDQSYERKPGGATSCYDTNNNAGDFALISPANPQNEASPIVMCAGVLPSTPTSTPTLTDSATAIATATSTNTSTATPTGTVTPSAPSHLVISEFRSRGPNGADDEFVELYNPSGAAVNIGAWIIKRSSSCGTSITNLATIPDNTILLAGQHYLAAATGSSVTGADLTYPASLADGGGVALVTALGTVVDQAGMCTSTQYLEGTNLLPLSGTSDQSYERKPGGATSCYDTNNNAGDFALISPANPQNEASPIVMCAGVLPSTPTSTPTSTLTSTPTRAPTAIPGTVVINEFLPHPRTDWNGDGTANTGDEYIELINMGTLSISLKNWKLDDGDGGSSPYTLPDMTLLSRQIAVFYHSETGISLSDGGDTVRLFKPDGLTADITTYPAVTAAERAWCRLPDGIGAWAFTCRPSPGKPNTPIESGTPGSGSTPAGDDGEDALSACLIDSAPQSVLSAECNSPGTRMWGEAGSGEIWLESHWKYDVFVE